MLHPAIAEIYCERVANLHTELNRPEMRAEDSQVLRALIDEIRLIPEDDALAIEIAGDLAGILALGPSDNRPAQVMGGSQVKLVAGTSNHRCWPRLRAQMPTR